MGPVSLDIVDPNNDVPDWDLNTQTDNDESSTNKFKGTKRTADGSPEGSLARKKKHEGFINDWQVAEFLSAYIDGTATTPNYSDANWLETEADTDYGHTNTTYSLEEVTDHADLDTNVDNE